MNQPDKPMSPVLPPPVSPLLSIVIPVLNEAPTLKQLHQEIDAVAGQNGYLLQVIYIDDGSTDSSWKEIEEIATQDRRVLGIRFRRNFGKAAALSAGFDAAEGEIIVMMDADLQDKPAEIPRLLAKLDGEEAFDVISGWKAERHDPWHKRWPSRVFNSLVGWLTGVKLHDHNCGFKAFRRDLIHEIRLYGELHRFIPVLAAARGFKVGETPVEHRPRTHGVSKYGIERIPKGLLDLMTVQFITRFGQRPQHWLGSLGLLALMIGGLGMTYLAIAWCVSRLPGYEPIHLHETAALYYSLVGVLLGTQLLAIGFVAEMIASLVSRERDAFSISQHTAPQRNIRARPAPEVVGDEGTPSEGSNE
ncbi:glycosyltransferase family 2 protein [Adhaeretor mobilis]|uniref:Undecaprenyl-phosphate 4-deoxy-4-formamido-L-arabinose transferase n=1 Tax=Adhaeretor mobilis TaxID=1930276 RepID=A0A517MVN0_9BACT|nr:glycosyltransferase family 2 protein [Adhaeretor mobilis]QDS98931.1 Undecaprenyl-phosphate 4-deoxy-4-formamido-L-arabinose transferase [Adhaeretor mobilis]